MVHEKPSLVGFQGICLLAALLCPGSLASVQATQLATPRPDFWDADGPIHSIVATNGRIYVGGEFSYIAPKGSKLLAVDRYTGETDLDFPPIYGAAVHSIIDDNNGGWFIGGEFIQVASTRITNLVHILPDNSIDASFRPNPDGPVQILLLDGATLFLGGDFAYVSGTARTRLASWNLSTQQLSSWAPAANATVSTFVLQDDILFAGGYFTDIGAQPRRNIAALNSSSGAVLDWRPDADGAVLSLALSGDRLYAGGFFNRIGGQLRNGLAALNPNSTNALPWDPNPLGGKVTTLRTVCSTVYVGGYFTNIAGQTRYRIAAVDGESAQALPWNPALEPVYSSNLKSYVLSMEVADNELFVGGQYSAQGHQDIAQFGTDSASAVPWHPPLDGGVQAIGISGRKVLVAVINSAGGVPRRNLAAFDEITGRALNWNPDPDGAVYALQPTGDRLFIGGAFLNLGDIPRTRLAAVNLGSGLVNTNWTASANNTVYALAADTNTLFAAGSFTSLNGTTRQRLGALKVDSGDLLPNWSAHADGTVYSLSLDHSTLYAGGNFFSIAAVSRNHVGALDKTSGQVKSWNPGANGTVHSVVANSGIIYLGGSFNTVAGQSRNFVAAVAEFGFLTPWAPVPNDEVRAIAVVGTDIFLGGLFQSISGQARFGLAATDLNGELLDFNPSTSPDNRVEALSHSGLTLYAGGTFPMALLNDPSLQTLAAFPSPGSPAIIDSTPNLETLSGQNVNLAVTATGQEPLRFQWKFAGIEIAGATNSSLALSNVQVTQSGIYEVVITNAVGALTTESRLLVVQPPAIVVGPSAQTVSPGATVALSVLATGNPAPLYQWRLNGANIPGAVFPVLTFANIDAAQSGNYDVLVANRFGLIASAPASVLVSAANLPFSDERSAATTGITSSSGTGAGSNVGATVESNEPTHASKPGGHSVWLAWTPPGTGIATLTTRGSDFDTLLAVYVPIGQSNLTAVAGDDDSAGFSGSRVIFNVQGGIRYLIAVDGAYGATGRIVLNWDLDLNPTPIPLITTQPVSQSTFASETISFSVAATSPSPLRYQWFFDCREIPNATNSTLVIPNVQRRNVGSYHVLVMNNSTRAAESTTVALEIGPRSDIVSHDKLEDVFLTAGGGGASSFKKGGTPPSAALAGGGGFLLVSMGSINSQILNNTGGSTQPGEPSHCGALGGASKWVGLHPTDSGVLVIDTIGSRIDTVLAVYTGTSSLNLHEVTCDDNGAPDHVRSLLRFNALANTDYLVAADGVNGAQGTVLLNWKLGLPPAFSSPPTTNIVNPGENLVLTARVDSAASPATYQWRCNGTNIPGATASSFVTPSLPSGIAASYSVVVSNAFGASNQLISRILVRQPSLPSLPAVVNGHLRIWLPPDSNQMFDLEGSSDLITWYWLEIIPDPANPNYYRDYPLDDTFTFFRAVPWQ